MFRPPLANFAQPPAGRRGPLVRACLSIAGLLLTFAAAGYAQADDVPKFEIGGQFTVLARNKPTPLFQSPTVVPDDFQHVNRFGVGARFTYNITDDVAVEAEGNFFPSDDEDQDLSVPAGSVYQAQAGVKAGKRFSRVGVFGKLRPGVVRFSRVSLLTGTHVITFNNQQFTVGDFTVGSKSYLSVDIGGVIEFYASRRMVARIDLGDTIIRYAAYQRQSFVVSQPYLERPAETRHSLQFSVGFGIRFK